MEILKFSEEHNNFRQHVRNFVNTKIVPNVEQWAKDKLMPKSMWKVMGEAGLLCPDMPREYGGKGGDFLHSVIVSEEMIKSGFFGAAPTAHSDIFVPYIAAYAPENLKQKYLPGCVSGDVVTAIGMTEPDAGSDLASMKTTVEEDGDTVVFNGSKIFISNGIVCDLLILAAKDPLEKNPHKAISLYLVEDGTPGFVRGAKLEKMGMHYQDTAELFFTDCRVPMANLIGEKGGGFKMLMDKLQQERLVVSIWAVNAAEYMLEKTLAFYKEHAGPGKQVSKSQASQFALVEMATDVKLARLFLDRLLVDHMGGEDVVLETSMEKFWATDMVNRLADRCLDIFEMGGSVDSCPIMKMSMDIKASKIYAGTNEIMKTIIAKYMNV